MRVLIFGATGMVGQGVLRECLRDPDVHEVVTIGRHVTGRWHSKLKELVHSDLKDYSSIEPPLTWFDACFFCLGVSSAGMREAEYEDVTYKITLSAAEYLASHNPLMTFVYVSGAGTDSSERGRVMWARVKGRTENALFHLPFKGVYMFRPGIIQPLHGIRSKTQLYRIFYTVARPFLSLLRVALPRYVTTTERVGQAMLVVAKRGSPKRILDSWDINYLARSGV